MLWLLKVGGDSPWWLRFLHFSMLCAEYVFSSNECQFSGNILLMFCRYGICLYNYMFLHFFTIASKKFHESEKLAGKCKLGNMLDLNHAAQMQYIYRCIWVRREEGRSRSFHTSFRLLIFAKFHHTVLSGLILFLYGSYCFTWQELLVDRHFFQIQEIHVCTLYHILPN